MEFGKAHTLLDRALRDTWAGLGLSWGGSAKWGVASVAFIGFSYLALGQEDAMNEATLVGLSVGALICPAVLLFIWNLWLAPYRVMNDRLKDALEAPLPAVIGQEAPRPIDPKDWEGVAAFTLEQAACLWVEVEPHSPISDMRASATLAKLQGAAALGQLECNRNRLTLFSAALAESHWRPDPSHLLTAVALRRYADVIGDVPAFLQAVSVPEPSQQLSEGSPQQRWR